MLDLDEMRRLRNNYLQSEQAYATRLKPATLRYYLRDRDALVRAAVDYFAPPEEVKVVADVDQGGAK